MADNTDKSLSPKIISLNINRLRGRMLLASSLTSKSREILVVYDQHSSLERWEPLVEELRRYGRVSMPDLPGFGGMKSFYSINQEASVNNMAAYLAAFIKLRYKRKSLTIVAIGFGFVVVTRLLQNYPDLVRKVKLVVAIDGFAHHEDRVITPSVRRLRLLTTNVLSNKLPAIFYRNIALYPLRLKLVSRKQLNIGTHKYDLADVDREVLTSAIRVNIKLWRNNDTRTFMKTVHEQLNLDNCQKTVKLPIYHIVSLENREFDAFRTEQHLGVVFTKVTTIPSELPSYSTLGILPVHKPSLILPRKLRNVLLKK